MIIAELVCIFISSFALEVKLNSEKNIVNMVCVNNISEEEGHALDPAYSDQINSPEICFISVRYFFFFIGVNHLFVTTEFVVSWTQCNSFAQTNKLTNCFIQVMVQKTKTLERKEENQ